MKEDIIHTKNHCYAFPFNNNARILDLITVDQNKIKPVSSNETANKHNESGKNVNGI
jgi:hypothetical protein